MVFNLYAKMYEEWQRFGFKIIYFKTNEDFWFKNLYDNYKPGTELCSNIKFLSFGVTEKYSAKEKSVMVCLGWVGSGQFSWFKP